MNELRYVLLRYDYSPTTTIGNFIKIGDMPQIKGYSLEDAVRPDGVKVFGHTAIPCGVYEIEMEYSPSADKDLPTLLNVKTHQYVRMHPVNDHMDTEGCIGVAENRSGFKIWGQVIDEIIDEIVRAKKQGRRVFVHIMQIDNIYV